VVDVLGIEGPLLLRVDAAGDHPSASLDLPAIGGMAVPVIDLALTDDSVAGRGLGGVPFSFRLAGEALRGEISGPQGAVSVVLHREDPRLRAFHSPLVDDYGNRVTAWTRTTPPATGDGWEVSQPGREGLPIDSLDSLGAAVAEARYPKVDAVLAAVDGRLVVEEYFHGFTRDRLHTFQSCSKAITSMVFGLAVDRGAIGSLDEPVWKFFEARTGHPWIDQRYPVTLHEALSMSAHLEWNEEPHYTDQRNDNTRMNAADDMIGYILDRGLQADRRPGRFEYQSALTILLGEVIHSATGKFVDELAAEFLFGPLGITEFRWLTRPDGTRHTGGGLFLRPRDMLKLAQVMLEGGTWEGRRVLSEEWVRRSTQPQSHGPDFDYGYQWFLPTVESGATAQKAIWASGYGGQHVFILPELGAVTVTTAHDFYGDGSGSEILGEHLLPALRARTLTAARPGGVSDA
jgi:CubicO group peptidase (beta-lactamase class C family)